MPEHYVFRFHEGEKKTDWFDSSLYNDMQIEEIKDPDGGSAIRPITSIPSPFARFDLINTALKTVVSMRSLDGNTIYHKHISDMLDIGQMFFNYDAVRTKGVEIVKYDPSIEIKALKENRQNEFHLLFGESISLYWQQDEKAFNFNSIDRLFFIKYNHRIIGGTSPITLFATSANDLSFVDIQFGQDKAFDDQFMPLHKRAEDYITYWYGLRKIIPDFATRFKALEEYLRVSFEELSRFNYMLWNQINTQIISNGNFTEEQFSHQHEKLAVGSEENDLVEVMGHNLYKKSSANNRKVIETNSDFVIQSPKYQNQNIGRFSPLVLQNNFSQKWRYTDHNWDPNTRVPYHSDEPLDERFLPDQSVQYPYLTVNDLLEPYLIQLPYPINRERYFNGNAPEGFGYILPLKKAYFDYFDTEDLRKPLPDGSKRIEMVNVSGGGVNVLLRIPVKKGFVTLSRIYNHPITSTKEPDVYENKGVIQKQYLSVTYSPPVPTPAPETPVHYRVQLVDSLANGDRNYELRFFQNSGKEIHQQGDTETPPTIIKRADKNTTKEAESVFHVLEKGFDYIEVNNGISKGVLMPIYMDVIGGSSQFKFAIDFGTTTTHIEYQKEKESIRAFDMTTQDSQIATLYPPDIDKLANLNPEVAAYQVYFNNPELFEYVELHFLPTEIHANVHNTFPQRTILSVPKAKSSSVQKKHPLADYNIPFYYGRKMHLDKIEDIVSNLKWSKFSTNPGNDDDKQVDAFLGNLLWLIRNKVLLNGGDLDKTELIWFYPSSMIYSRKKALQRKWNELFRVYISTSTEKTPLSLSESIAPFYLYKSDDRVNARDLPVVSVDIGGGTTDIVIFEDNKPTLTTSAIFGANAIWGDGYGGTANNNGFIKLFHETIENQIKESEQTKLLDILKYLLEQKHSEDIIAFYFSLENNRDLKQKRIKISFSEMIKAEDKGMRIVLLIYYCAIVYHIARLMKVTDKKPPRYLLFSGTGSGVLKLIDEDSAKMEGLTKLTHLIFEHIYGIDNLNKEKTELKLHSSPKEITSKGGLAADANVFTLDMDEIKTVLVGSDNRVSTEQNKIKYADVPTLYKDVEAEYQNFLTMFFGLNLKINLQNYFEINSTHFEQCKSLFNQGILNNIIEGYERKKAEINVDEDQTIEETLFFYPLFGSLNEVADKIAEGL